MDNRGGSKPPPYGAEGSRIADRKYRQKLPPSPRKLGATSLNEGGKGGKSVGKAESRTTRMRAAPVGTGVLDCPFSGNTTAHHGYAPHDHTASPLGDGRGAIKRLCPLERQSLFVPWGWGGWRVAGVDVGGCKMERVAAGASPRPTGAEGRRVPQKYEMKTGGASPSPTAQRGWLMGDAFGKHAKTQGVAQCATPCEI